MSGSAPIRLLALVRLGYGGALLASPEALASRLTGQRLDLAGRDIAKVLGGRHVVQAVVVGLLPTPVMARLGSVVDGLHAASMVALGAVDESRRRTSWTDAGLETAFALLGLASAGSR